MNQTIIENDLEIILNRIKNQTAIQEDYELVPELVNQYCQEVTRNISQTGQPNTS